MAAYADNLESISTGVVAIKNRPLCPAARHELAKHIGCKGAGLALLPPAWTPPFIAVEAQVFTHWQSLMGAVADEYLIEVSANVAKAARDWSDEWRRGVCLRSSATKETLNERGTYNSLELTADFDGTMIARSIAQIYRDFIAANGSGEMAIVVQARAATVALGHMSNEQRVSKTINQWTWEYEPADKPGRRFNSQRDVPPDQSRKLDVSQFGIAQLQKLFRKIGRWCTKLDIGRTHLEWGISDGILWIFQFDLEADQPDLGVDPNSLMRDGHFSPSVELSSSTPFRLADLTGQTGWKKIDKVASLRDADERPYPSLIYITGSDFQAADLKNYGFSDDLETFASGRIVCRTDCTNANIAKLNLPRTHTVSSVGAVDFMRKTLAALMLQGATPDEICFILHKFIPALTAAWAVAQPSDPVVRVDSLWGLPDGLQFLPHDSFEFDVVRSQQSTERITYKPAYLQETSSGKWEVNRVSRRFGRSRSLPAPDLAYIAQHTHKVANNVGKNIQIMWFCRVPDETGLPANIPWFAMTPHGATKTEQPVSPAKRRFVVRSMTDLEAASLQPRGQVMLQIDPDDPELFRSNDFLDQIRTVASERDFPVGLTGSILGHAFYVLEKAGLSVVAFNEPTRTRIRQRQVFHKLVRDEIPKRISEGGETVTLAEIAPEEARAALVGKIFEESFELLSADAPTDATAELADILEVVQSLANSTGVDWNEVVNVAKDKRGKRGGFDKNIVLMETALPGWKADVRQTHSTVIPLKELNQVSKVGGAVVVPFSTLLGNRFTATVQLADGSTIQVGIGPDGISLAPWKSESIDDQLEFPLE